MKYFLSLVLIFFVTIPSFAQVSLRGSMGVDYVSTPSFYDYINQNFASANDQIGSFKAAITLTGEGDYAISKSYQLGVELGYRFFSFTTLTGFGNYDISYHNIMPTLVNYYVINGDGYMFKFGCGVGVRFLKAKESIPGTNTTTGYTSTGFGFLLRASGDTRLSDKFYVNILADMRYDLNGEPANNGKKLYNNISKNSVNFNSFSVGLSLGLIYFL